MTTYTYLWRFFVEKKNAIRVISRHFKTVCLGSSFRSGWHFLGVRDMKINLVHMSEHVKKFIVLCRKILVFSELFRDLKL